MLLARLRLVGPHDTNKICARQAKSTVIIALFVWNCMLVFFLWCSVRINRRVDESCLFQNGDYGVVRVCT